MAVEPLDTRVLDGAARRADFPVFERPTRSGQPLSYLDSASSAQKPRAVIDAVADAYAHHYANVHRGIYELSVDADARFEGARRALAAFIGAPSEREVIFVRNATEALNLVAYSWGRANVGPGDLVVSTGMEHHANLVPWQQLAAATGATLAHVAITDDGRLDLDDLDRLLDLKPRLVTLAHVSNALGTINPVADIAARAHDVGAIVVLDAAQSVPHMPVDVAALGRRLRGALRSQDARPVGDRCALGPPRPARRDAPVPDRRQHDHPRHPRDRGVERGAVEVRGGHAGDRRGDRPRGGRRVPRRHRHGHGEGARAGPLRGGVARTRARSAAFAGSARTRPTSMPASSASSSTASTRTTSPRSSIATGSPSAPAITARSR